MPEVQVENRTKSLKHSWLSSHIFTPTLLAVGTVLYGAMVSIPNYIENRIEPIPSILKILGLILGVFGLSRFTLNYLGSSRGESRILITEQQIDPKTQNVTVQREVKFTGVSGVEASQILASANTSQIAGSPTLQLGGLDPENCVAYYRSIVEESRGRLAKEIAALGRRGNLNLVIGFTTTLFSVVFLAYIVLTAGNVFANLNTLLAHYIPRITVAVFIEVFAFFFLRLYRSALIDIKYYQNELTALASMSIALEAALSAKDKKTLGDVLAVIAKTNPNASAPTAESAKGPIDVKDVTDLLERFAKIILHGKTDEAKEKEK